MTLKPALASLAADDMPPTPAPAPNQPHCCFDTARILAGVRGRQLAGRLGLGSAMLTNYDRRLLLAHIGRVRVSSKMLVI
jgi:hypothetical protein